jgi:hypothetical protein
MYKHYGATNPDLTEYLEQHSINPEMFTLENAKNFHDYYAEKNKHTEQSAQEELEEMLLDCSEVKGEECTIEDLGWDSEESAIAFIKSTMNFTAIILELKLTNNREELKEFLLDKIKSTQIKCRTIGGKCVRKKFTQKSKSSCKKHKHK